MKKYNVEYGYKGFFYFISNNEEIIAVDDDEAAKFFLQNHVGEKGLWFNIGQGITIKRGERFLLDKTN